MPEFFDPSSEKSAHGYKLPHWQQEEAMQFITFRLKDSMPANKMRTWKEELETWTALNPKPWPERIAEEYHKRFTWKLEAWLDEGHGECLLEDTFSRTLLEETLMHDEGVRAIHQAWVIMPNHVHLLFTPLAPIEAIIKSWKGVSARKIGAGSIWQKNYRDTLIRDSEHFGNAVKYIRRNPAKLFPGSFTLWESERAKMVA